MEDYTLHDYFVAAGLKHPVSFAKFIKMNPEKLPMPHQISGLNKAIKSDRFGLYDDPGLGKSLISHAWALYWISEGQRVVAVLPATLIYQYAEEMKDLYRGVEDFITIKLLDDDYDKRQKVKKELEKERPQMVILSYQMFLREHQWFIANEYRAFIADEAQALKGCESKTHKAVENLLEQKGGSACLLMTGTPVYNTPVDAFALINLTSPGMYESFRQFERRHCIYEFIEFKEPKVLPGGRKLRGFRQLKGYKRLDEMRVALYRNGRRVIRDDVKQIDTTVTEVPVRLAPEHLSLYKKLMRERILEVDGELITALQQQQLRMTALQLATCPEAYVDEGVQIKNNVVGAIRALCESAGINQTKVVLFVNFQQTVRSFEAHFADLNPALMYGGSDSEKNRVKFLHDPTCRLLIANPVSAGAGFNFQSVSHTIIFGEPTGVPGQFKQASERVVRWGQMHRVNIYIIKALGTIAPKATKQMLEKEGYVQEINRDRTSLLDEFIPA